MIHKLAVNGDDWHVCGVRRFQDKSSKRPSGHGEPKHCPDDTERREGSQNTCVDKFSTCVEGGAKMLRRIAKPSPPLPSAGGRSLPFFLDAQDETRIKVKFGKWQGRWPIGLWVKRGKTLRKCGAQKRKKLWLREGWVPSGGVASHQCTAGVVVVGFHPRVPLGLSGVVVRCSSCST